ncbi:MAG: membrane dipeptidase [Acidobacteria bacterium]|nr:membrane dipeptidase [Acidobacteriota bacterium]
MAGGFRHAGVLKQVMAQSFQQAPQQIEQWDRLAADFDRGVGAGVLEQALQGAQHSPFTVALPVKGFPAVQTLVAAHGNQRRKPLFRAALGSFKSHHRVVAAVGGRDDNPGGAEVDANPHRVRLQDNSPRGKGEPEWYTPPMQFTRRMLLAAPAVLMKRHRLWGVEYTARAIDLVNSATVIDMLAPFQLNRAKFAMQDPASFTEADLARYGRCSSASTARRRSSMPRKPASISASEAISIWTATTPWRRISALSFMPLTSAKAAPRGAKPLRNTGVFLPRARSVLRVFLKKDRSGNDTYGFREKDDIEGLNHPKRMVDLAEGLIRRKYTDEHIRGILGGNFLRVLREIWGK